uniref:glycoside hydrolase family 16 protein n=1 Tax=uncultured Dysgonomonas sp. TaxID=206096 RepID=UPI002611A43A|nr:glycoside hydrolase family 16 protein [uncultured Dysgonomonas sp.]
MKKTCIVFVLFGISFFASCEDNHQEKLVSDNYQLVWSDEFNYEGLPDSSNWTFEEGYRRNNEPQFYTKNRLENVSVGNGILKIKARNEDWLYKNIAKVTSGSITTGGKHAWKYGRFDIMAKVPTGKTVWPAIWMLGDSHYADRTYNVEIDIMEYYGYSPKEIHNVLHYRSSDNLFQKKINVESLGENAYNGFHLYSILWDEKQIIYAIDNQITFVCDISKINSSYQPFNEPLYLLINLALLSSNLDKEQEFEIDYVRVYQKIQSN